MSTSEFYPRLVRARLHEALADSPVVLLHGPRQCGKTTLARSLELDGGRQYVTLDDAATLTAVQADPGGFVLDLEGVDCVLDVGGGWGHFSKALCKKRPGLQATVLDIPEVVKLAAADLVGTELGDRIEFVPGDYLATDYGSGFDLVLYANVLHQETADRAAEMVRRGAEALAPDGRVVVVDFAIDDAQREHLLGALFAVNMRSFGDTWPEPVIRGWMEAAGLAEIERTDLGPDRWIISGRKPKV